MGIVATHDARVQIGIVMVASVGMQTGLMGMTTVVVGPREGRNHQLGLDHAIMVQVTMHDWRSW